MTRDQFFGAGRGTVWATAPGRLDVIGGIADYSGALVLEMPIAPRTRVELALRSDGVFRVHSANAEALDSEATVEVEAGADQDRGGEIEYGALRERLTEPQQWVGYVVGCAQVLAREKGLGLEGADIYVSSDVPPGKGVSASAALEVATMAAMLEAIGAELGETELPMLCQKVENLVVGAPCGLMDQLACYLGRADHLLPILCQPDVIGRPVAIPEAVRFVGIDSGVRHSVGGASYADVRTAAFMGYTIIAQAEGGTRELLDRARESGDTAGLPHGGYLANIPVSRFEAQYRDLLPATLDGAEFSRQFGGLTDRVTGVDAQTRYAVAAATRHPVYENHRVRLFAQLLHLLGPGNLSAGEQDEVLIDLGELMYQAHVSYGVCGLGEEITDEIVQQARDAGPAQGLYGAKITGGGSGGTVCLLCAGSRGVESAGQIARDIAARQGREPVLFTGSSPGARWSGEGTGAGPSPAR